MAQGLKSRKSDIGCRHSQVDVLTTAPNGQFWKKSSTGSLHQQIQVKSLLLKQCAIHPVILKSLEQSRGMQGNSECAEKWTVQERILGQLCVHLGRILFWVDLHLGKALKLRWNNRVLSDVSSLQRCQGWGCGRWRPSAQVPGAHMAACFSLAGPCCCGHLRRTTRWKSSPSLFPSPFYILPFKCIEINIF